MKRVLLIVVSLVFAFGVLITSALQTSLPMVRAQQPETVEYFLPYPGLLPGHFLYPIKMARDKILLFLTTEPVKKSERLLHFSDKRIEAARLLAEQDESELAASTAVKAEKYLEQAAEQMALAAAKAEDTKPLWEKLSKASLKHEEILILIMEAVDPEMQSTIDQARQYPQAVYQKALENLL